jgi:hypothetical protein
MSTVGIPVISISRWIATTGKFYMVCDYAAGELTLMEPQKCEEWKWFCWDEIPRPLFLAFENLLKKQFTPFAS